MESEEAIEIIHEKHMDMEFYFAEHDRYPKYYDFEFDQATLIAAQALKEIQQYREIGTVEECREAIELQKPKKPIPINHKEYADKIVNAEFLEDAYLCPNCKTVIRSGSHCGRCGQKLN